MNNLVISWIRTVVPYAVGLGVSALITLGVEVPEDVQTWLINTLTFLLGSLYYWLARKLEQRNPRLGWLLGVAAQPKY